MTSALNEAEIVFDTFATGSEAYATKPINLDRMVDVMKNLLLIK